MREIGLELPKRKMVEFQKQMNVMAKQNYKKMMEQADKKMPKADVQ